MHFIQKIFGYLFLFSLIDLIAPLKVSVIVFVSVSVFIKIDYHPQNHKNPFAFAVRLRNLHLVHRR